MRNFQTNFEREEDYYKPVRLSNLWKNNKVKYESNDDKNKNL